MPTYELKCQKCGHEFSVFCSISARDGQKCPSCGNSELAARFTKVNTLGNKSGGSSGPNHNSGCG